MNWNYGSLPRMRKCHTHVVAEMQVGLFALPPLKCLVQLCHQEQEFLQEP